MLWHLASELRGLSFFKNKDNAAKLGQGQTQKWRSRQIQKAMKVFLRKTEMTRIIIQDAEAGWRGLGWLIRSWQKFTWQEDHCGTIKLSSQLWCWHHIWLSAWVLDIPLLIQLPANISEKAVEDGSRSWILVTYVGHQGKVPGSWLWPDPFWLLQPPSADGVSLSFPLTVLLK